MQKWGLYTQILVKSVYAVESYAQNHFKHFIIDGAVISGFQGAYKDFNLVCFSVTAYKLSAL